MSTTAINMISNILAVILYIGGPILPLMLLTLEVGKWHQENLDPDDIEAVPNHHS